MPHILYTAKGPNGNTVRGFVPDTNSDEAIQRLMETGLCDIELHRQPPASDDNPTPIDTANRSEAAMVSFKRQLRMKPRWRSYLLAYAKRLRFVFLLEACVALMAVWWSVWLALSIFCLCVLLSYGWMFWSDRYARAYAQFLWAYSVGDAAHAGRCAQTLRQMKDKPQDMEFDLDVRLACLAVRKSPLNSALALLDSWHERMTDQASLWESRVASVHAAAGDRAGFVAAMERAYTASGKDSSRALDWALALARFGDVGLAKAVLETIEPSVIPPVGQGFLLWARGMCEFRQKHAQALDTLNKATAHFLGLVNQPSAWLAIAFCCCDRAIALAQYGELAQAKRHLARVWPVIRAHADKPLFLQLLACGLLKG